MVLNNNQKINKVVLNDWWV